MPKKYSVNLENDEVVSVAVDGVEYASADDIPDPVDREKVNELIIKMTGNDFDAESEDDFDREFKDFNENFDREFKEAQRESAKFPTVLFTVFLSVAVLMLGIAFFSGFMSYRSLQKEQSTPGKVVDTVERQSVETTSGRVITYSYPVVEFNTPSGQQRVELSVGSSPPEFKTGDAVTVMYDPDKPQDARIDSFSNNLMVWILPGITGIIGTVFLIVALIVLRVHRSQVEELEASQTVGLSG